MQWHSILHYNIWSDLPLEIRTVCIFTELYLVTLVKVLLPAPALLLAPWTCQPITVNYPVVHNVTKYSTTVIPFALFSIQITIKLLKKTL